MRSAGTSSRALMVATNWGSLDRKYCDGVYGVVVPVVRTYEDVIVTHVLGDVKNVFVCLAGDIKPAEIAPRSMQISTAHEANVSTRE